MTTLVFVPREKLSEYEWAPANKRWVRPKVDHEVLDKLCERSTLNGFLRVGWFMALLAASAAATIWVSRINIWLAIPVLYSYYFLYGFWVAIAHELQHRMVFAKSLNWFSDIFFFFVQVLLWNSPRYARISHQLHHRYTMVRGIDPETDWPDVITSKWLKKFLRDQILA
ncbi:MAG: fatty acid desaturase, partial [Verrucomicrobia bacterium]|nr:fatty acid desaturase [Verrucomicrobiota bacterium]